MMEKKAIWPNIIALKVSEQFLKNFLRYPLKL